VKAGTLIALICVFGGWYYLRTHFAGWILSATSGETPACLELVGSTTSEIDGVTHIIGSVRNNCDRKFLMVSISFKIARTNSDQAVFRDFPEAVAVASVRDLQPGETGQFRSAVPVSKDTIYRLDRLSAY
jgi:hypothetical protein